MLRLDKLKPAPGSRHRRKIIGRGEGSGHGGKGSTRGFKGQTARSGTWFNLGSFDDSTRGREEEAAAVLRHAGAVDVTDDIRSAKWMKLVANAAEMLPSAILDMPLVEALAVPGMREVMDAAGSEALDTALRLGHKIVPMFGQEGIDELPPEGLDLEAMLEAYERRMLENQLAIDAVQRHRDE